MPCKEQDYLNLIAANGEVTDLVLYEANSADKTALYCEYYDLLGEKDKASGRVLNEVNPDVGVYLYTHQRGAKLLKLS